MEQLDKIRNRINKKEKKSKLLSFLSLFMAFLSILLGIMIYMKKDENGTFLNENFNVSVNFKDFNEKSSNIINNLFKFEFENKIDDIQVSDEITYIEKGENCFVTDDNSIKMLDDGIVLGVYEKDYQKSILVSYSNGVLASYSLCEDVLVKQYDQLEKGDVLSSYTDNFKVLFRKDNKLVNYYEAFK